MAILSGCGAPPPNATPGDSPVDGCMASLEFGPFGRGANVIGEGYRPDATVTFEFSDSHGDTMTVTEADDPAMRTDIRGRFEVGVGFERELTDLVTVTAEAGGCVATATDDRPFVAYPPECVPSAEVDPSGAARSAAYEELVLADNPLAYWRFEEAAPTADAAGPRSGTFEGPVAPGQAGVAGSVGLLLTGGWLPVAPPIELVRDFTIEAWAFPCGDSVDNADALVGQGGEGPDVNLFDARLRLWTGESDVAWAADPLPLERWVHLAVVRSDGVVSIVVDGEVVGSGPYTAPFPVAAIGSGNAGTFEGWLDEVAIFDHAIPVERLVERTAAGRE
jgi:hypothetical protein